MGVWFQVKTGLGKFFYGLKTRVEVAVRREPVFLLTTGLTLLALFSTILGSLLVLCSVWVQSLTIAEFLRGFIDFGRSHPSPTDARHIFLCAAWFTLPGALIEFWTGLEELTGSRSTATERTPSPEVRAEFVFSGLASVCGCGLILASVLEPAVSLLRLVFRFV